MAEDPKPRRGRPRNVEVYSRVSTWVSARDHERLIARAKQADKSVSATIRDLLKPPFRN